MKKILSIFLISILLMAFSSVAFAGEKVVQLNVPGCSALRRQCQDQCDHEKN